MFKRFIDYLYFFTIRYLKKNKITIILKIIINNQKKINYFILYCLISLFSINSVVLIF